TRDGLEARPTCYLCDQEAETCDHIFVHCSYAKHLWWQILQALGVARASQANTLTLPEWWEHTRNLFTGTRKKGYDSLFTLVVWQLWKERNAQLFRSTEATVQQLLTSLKQEMELWIAAGAT
ncbi:hypothetical protein BAE44_0012140, partial [Dichanthelium oligosanthes]